MNIQEIVHNSDFGITLSAIGIIKKHNFPLQLIKIFDVDGSIQREFQFVFKLTLRKCYGGTMQVFIHKSILHLCSNDFMVF